MGSSWKTVTPMSVVNPVAGSWYVEQCPPSRALRSTTTTLLPRSRSRTAVYVPEEPPPITTTSRSITPPRSPVAVPDAADAVPGRSPAASPMPAPTIALTACLRVSSMRCPLVARISYASGVPCAKRIRPSPRPHHHPAYRPCRCPLSSAVGSLGLREQGGRAYDGSRKRTGSDRCRTAGSSGRPHEGFRAAELGILARWGAYAAAHHHAAYEGADHDAFLDRR